MRGYTTHVYCSKCQKWWRLGDLQKYDPDTYRCNECNQHVRTTTRWEPKEVKRY